MADQINVDQQASSCPSRIVATVNNDGHVVVDYWKTHLGHQKLAKYIRMDKKLRRHIKDTLTDASELNIFNARLNFAKSDLTEIAKRDDVIIGNIHEASYSNKLPLRASLVSSKDLWNLKKKYLKPYRTYRHPIDSISVNLWVEENRRKKKFTILFHKNIDTVHYGLREDDYILIIMTKKQAEMLQEFGSDRICVDATHGTNCYNYQLHTLMVIDEFGSGVPVAFFFANRQDEVTCRIFFEEISKAVGKINTKSFMTDDCPAYFNAWSSVMGAPQHKLLCSWHVSRSWKRAAAAKIVNKEKGDLIYEKLLTLKMILDEREFRSSLNNFLGELEGDDDTKSFVTYFRKAYCYRETTWAYCFRIGLGINTNMFLESHHNQMKKRVMRRKCSKRMDKAIDIVLKTEMEAFIFRNKRINGVCISTRQRESIKRHKRSEDINQVQIISDKKWSVSSYVVTQAKQTCNSICMRCETCKICFHTYSCTCVDYLIRSIICQHIHACVTFFPSDTGFKRDLLERDMVQKYELLRCSDDSSTNILINNSTADIKETKATAENLFFQIHNVMFNIGYDESLAGTLEKNFEHVLQLIAPKENSTVNINIKMDCQRRKKKTGMW
ncbi:uncharacterized protein LOC113371341 [Ctenocephalides felis]|uniref:uncharacterized protein LOC113371341 n=1 Tax=Ctenocephalides felis TaxID=7515 RepID=UPI000E6E4A4C|nr:uncharacterized protein LOC113371341 [Ctenocephalides felis]